MFFSKHILRSRKDVPPELYRRVQEGIDRVDDIMGDNAVFQQQQQQQTAEDEAKRYRMNLGRAEFGSLRGPRSRDGSRTGAPVGASGLSRQTSNASTGSAAMHSRYDYKVRRL